MPTFTVGQAADLLGVSADTVRRWIDDGQIAAARGPGGRRTVDGAALARFSADRAEAPAPDATASARNHFTGLVTKVTRDKVMAQVEIQAGPFRVVSLISREAADQLELAPGVLAVASVKSTNVLIEIPRR
jgi:molybdopterin-binding protein